MAAHPGDVEIDEHVMCHVQGIGKVAEEFADFGFGRAARHAAGTEEDDGREDDDNAKCFVQTIEPEAICATNSGHEQNGRYEEAAPKKGIIAAMPLRSA